MYSQTRPPLGVVPCPRLPTKFFFFLKKDEDCATVHNFLIEIRRACRRQDCGICGLPAHSVVMMFEGQCCPCSLHVRDPVSFVL